MAFNRDGFTKAAKAMGYTDAEINQVATLREEQERQRMVNPSTEDQMKDLQLKQAQLNYQQDLSSQPTKSAPVSNYLTQPTPTVGQPSAYITKPKIDPMQFVKEQPDTQFKNNTQTAPEKTMLQKGGDLLYGAAKFLAPKTVSQYEKAFGAQDFAKQVMADKSLTEKQKAEKVLNYVKDIRSGELKSGLELSSYLVPAGKGITGAAKMGAVMGAMRGASEGEGALPDIGSTLKGAAGGAAGGAIIGVGAKALKGLVKNVPERIMNSLFREPIKATKAAIGKGETLGEKALQKGEMGGVEGIYQKALNKTQEIEQQLQDKLFGTNKVVSIDSVRKTAEPMINKYTQAGNKQAAQAIIDRIGAIESESGSLIPAARANEIKRTLYDEARKAYGTEASAGMEGIKTIARGIKEQIGNVPGIKQLNQDLSYYGRVADSMADQIARTGGRNNLLSLTDAVLAGFGGPTGIAAVVGRNVLGSSQAKTVGAQGLYQTGKMLEKAAPAVLPPITKGAQLVGSKVPSMIGQQLPTPSVQETIQNVPDTEQYKTDTTEVQHNIPIISENKPNRLEQLSQAYSKALEAGDDKAAERIKKMYDMEKESSPTAKKKTAEVARYEDAADQLGQLETFIDKFQGKMGPVQGRISAMNVYDTDAQELQAQIKAVAQIVGIAMEKGVLRKEDIPKYEAILPNIKDTPEVARRKIANVKKVLGRSAMNLQNMEQPSVTTLPEIK